ncbi:hypothetical protein D3C72_2115240 [compost metagenome]
MVAIDKAVMRLRGKRHAHAAVFLRRAELAPGKGGDIRVAVVVDGMLDGGQLQPWQAGDENAVALLAFAQMLARIDQC